MTDILFQISIAFVLIFAFVNGFHDGGNVLGSVICSRSMVPVRALGLAVLFEFVGPLVLGTAVARTMASSILKPDVLIQLNPIDVYLIVISGVGGAIAWKIPTWYFGLPSSGSHALIGGLVGAGVVCVGFQAVPLDRVIIGVFLPLLISPLVGMLVGFFVFSFIRYVFSGSHRSIGILFVLLQRPALAILAAVHGSNDAQKSIGVIGILLALQAGKLDGAHDIPWWAIVSCAACLALGVSVGGWRIVKTVGFGIWRMEPVHSFSSQFAALTVIGTASLIGGPVSTAQVVASSIVGVGASCRLSGIRWSVAAQIAYAWLLTVPASALIAGGACRLLKQFVV
jgi:inorganic phosphate transporter, PiT family